MSIFVFISNEQENTISISFVAFIVIFPNIFPSIYSFRIFKLGGSVVSKKNYKLNPNVVVIVGSNNSNKLGSTFIFTDNGLVLKYVYKAELIEY